MQMGRRDALTSVPLAAAWENQWQQHTEAVLCSPSHGTVCHTKVGQRTVGSRLPKSWKNRKTMELFGKVLLQIEFEQICARICPGHTSQHTKRSQN